MDQQDTGIIVLQDFVDYLQDERVSSYLHALKINTEDAHQLFRLLDTDSSGEIYIDEFVEGCMKIKGEAKSMDMHVMMCENRRMLSVFTDFMEVVDQKFSEIADVPAIIRGILHAAGASRQGSINVGGGARSMPGSMLNSAVNSRTNSLAVALPTSGDTKSSMLLPHSNTPSAVIKFTSDGSAMGDDNLEGESDAKLKFHKARTLEIPGAAPSHPFSVVPS